MVCGGEKTEGNRIGQYKETTDYNAAYSAATAILENKTLTNEEYEAAYNTLKAAYEALINDYKAVNPDIEVVMMTSPPVLSENTLSISNEILDTKTYALQLEIAEELGIKLLDFRAYLKGLSGGYDDYYRDGVHFNEAGAQLFADFVAKGI